MFKMKKHMTSDELAASLINDATLHVDAHWERFEAGYKDDNPVDFQTARREFIAARLASICVVLREVIVDREQTMKVVSKMENLVTDRLEAEIGTQGIWQRTKDYIGLMNNGNVKARDAELYRVLLESPNTEPMYMMAFEADMSDIVTKYVNVVTYCGENKIVW